MLVLCCHKSFFLSKTSRLVAYYTKYSRNRRRRRFSSRNYVSINGDSTVGIHRSWMEGSTFGTHQAFVEGMGGTEDVESSGAFPEGVDCMIAGLITYVEK